MREPNYFVEAYETRRGRKARFWRARLRDLAWTAAVLLLLSVFLIGSVSAYAALASPFPLI